ncbi:MAG: hypothetical protein IJ870_03785 [Alphaproteobacteria bacterium]|nr:hypothetical protein [Alphaproteobacteria bacterium]
MKQIAFLLIFVLLLFACAANNANYNKELEQWVGQPVKALETAWGKPTGQKIISANTRVLTYTKTSEYFVPTEYYYDNLGWGATDLVYDPFFGEYEMTPYAQIVDTEVQGICQTSFVVNDGVIRSYQWRGNGCQ